MIWERRWDMFMVKQLVLLAFIPKKGKKTPQIITVGLEEDWTSFSLIVIHFLQLT